MDEAMEELLAAACRLSRGDRGMASVGVMATTYETKDGVTVADGDEVYRVSHDHGWSVSIDAEIVGESWPMPNKSGDIYATPKAATDAFDRLATAIRLAARIAAG